MKCKFHYCKLAIVPTLGLLILLSVIGCSTIVGTTTGTRSQKGSPIDEEYVSKIKDYVTLQDQVLSWFGQPRMSKILDDGSILWTYIYRRQEADLGFWLTPAGAGGKDASKVTNHQTLEIILRDGLVIQHSYSRMK